MKEIRSAKLSLALLILPVLLFYSVGIRGPLEYLPDFQAPRVSIITEHAAPPETIERETTDPVEKIVLTLPGIYDLESVSGNGMSRIDFRIDEHGNPDTIINELYIKLSAIARLLPPAASPPGILRSASDEGTIFIASFREEKAMHDQIRDAFSAVEGISEVTLSGGKSREIRIIPDFSLLSTGRLSGSDITGTIHRGSKIYYSGPDSRLQWLYDERIRSPGDIGMMEFLSGSRIRDWTEIEEKVPERGVIDRIDGKPTVTVFVKGASGENIVTLCRNLRVLTGELEGTVLHDHGKHIEKAVSETLLSAAAGACAVSLLLITGRGKDTKRKDMRRIFLLGIVPFSSGIALFSMRLSGFSINLMTLAGIAMGLGASIDCGVIRMEFSSLYGKEGGKKYSTPPVLISTITSAAVFFPLLFTGNEISRRFGGLAFAYTSSLAGALIFTFLLLPPFLSDCAAGEAGIDGSDRLDKSGQDAGFLEKASSGAFTLIRKHPVTWLIGLSFLTASVLIMAVSLPRSEFPLLGGNIQSFRVEFPSGTTMDSVMRQSGHMEKELSETPGVEKVIARYERERALFTILLSDLSERGNIIEKTRHSGFGEGTPIFSQEEMGKTWFRTHVFDPDLDRAALTSSRLASLLSADPKMETYLHFKDPPAVIEINLSHKDILSVGTGFPEAARSVHRLFSGAPFQKYAPPGDTREFDIRFDSGHNSFPEYFDTMISSPSGPVPLSGIACHRKVTGNASIRRIMGQRALTLTSSFYYQDQAEALKIAARAEKMVPSGEGTRIETAVEEQERKALRQSAAGLLLLGSMTVWIIIHARYPLAEQRLLILLQIPMTFLLPTLLLRFTGEPLSLSASVGYILCAGVAVNNGVVLFDPRRMERMTGNNMEDAFKSSIKPVFLSTATTCIAAAPLLLLDRGLLFGLSLVVVGGTGGSFFLIILSAGLYAGFSDILSHGPYRRIAVSRSLRRP